jgi:hypothetical protein
LILPNGESYQIWPPLQSRYLNVRPTSLYALLDLATIEKRNAKSSTTSREDELPCPFPLDYQRLTFLRKCSPDINLLTTLTCSSTDKRQIYPW